MDAVDRKGAWDRSRQSNKFNLRTVSRFHPAPSTSSVNSFLDTTQSAVAMGLLTPLYNRKLSAGLEQDYG